MSNDSLGPDEAAARLHQARAVEFVPDWRAAVQVLARSRPPSLLLACMPKSGSTFFAAVLSAAAGYPQRGLVAVYDRNEQDLYLPALVGGLLAPSPFVTQQHVRATGPNLDLVGLFGLRPVVLVRNLFDALVSLHDHFMTEDVRAPSAYVPDTFRAAAPAERLDFVVDVAAPWYVGFYASWWEARRAGVETHWVRYEDMVADPERAAADALAFGRVAGGPWDLAAAVAAARSGPTRFNKGVAGRGKTVLSDGQRERVLRLTGHYPGVDFSPVLG